MYKKDISAACTGSFSQPVIIVRSYLHCTLNLCVSACTFAHTQSRARALTHKQTRFSTFICFNLELNIQFRSFMHARAHIIINQEQEQQQRQTKQKSQLLIQSSLMFITDLNVLDVISLDSLVCACAVAAHLYTDIYFGSCIRTRSLARSRILLSLVFHWSCLLPFIRSGPCLFCMRVCVCAVCSVFFVFT